MRRIVVVRTLRYSRVAAVLCATGLLLFPFQTEAQESHWGATFSFVPQWKAIPEIYDHIWDVDERFAPDGKEFRVGVVRGSDEGGDWSVTFVRNWFQVDQVFDDTFSPFEFIDENGDEQFVGLAGSVFTVPGDIEYVGVKYEKFTPFVTIRDRVQIGMTYGGGIGSLRGTVIEQRFDTEVDFRPPSFDPVVTNQTETIIEHDVKDFYTPGFVPIGSVEAAVAFIIAPGLKARITGGFNYPNTQIFSFTVNYLVGS